MVIFPSCLTLLVNCEEWGLELAIIFYFFYFFFEGIVAVARFWEAATNVGYSMYHCLCAEMWQPATMQFSRGCLSLYDL